MEIEKLSPLAEVGANYILEINPDLNPTQLGFAKHIINKYVTNQINYDEFVFQLKDIVRSSIPLERIKAIMDCASDPIPKSPEIENEKKDSRKKTRSWNKYEDNRLLCGVNKYGLENWAQIAFFVGNGRTRSMCSQRWIRVLDPKISKAHWSAEEERKLVHLVYIHGEKNWMKVANKFGNRSDVQCRYKYIQMKKSGKINYLAQRMFEIPTIRNMQFIERQYPSENTAKNIQVIQQPPQKEVTPIVETQIFPSHIQNEVQLRIEEQLELETYEFFKSDPFFDIW